MSNKMHLLTACIVAFTVLLLLHHPLRGTGSTHSATPKPGATGTAAVNVDRRGDLLLFTLTFRDPQGDATAPRMNVEPTFAVVNSTGQEVYHGAFTFG